MSVMKGFQGGLRISISKKEKPGGWWGDNFDLPPELLPEMAEMLNEAYEGL